MGYTVHGYKYPCSHCDHGHTMALLVLWPCSHHTKLFPSYSWLSSKATTKEAFHGATNQLLGLDVLPSTAPRHPWTHEHCWYCTMNAPGKAVGGTSFCSSLGKTGWG